MKPSNARTLAGTLTACLVALTGAACGGGDSTTTTTSAVPAPAGPSAMSGGSGASGGGTTNAWVSATDTVLFCDFVACPGGQGFTVSSDGKYRIASGASFDGRLTDVELAAFNSAANAVAAQSLAPTPSCQTRAVAPGAFNYQESMAFSDGRELTIIDKSGTQVCYNGSQTLAEAMRAQFDALERKYNPIPTPGSGPSGSSGASGGSGGI